MVVIELKTILFILLLLIGCCTWILLLVRTKYFRPNSVREKTVLEALKVAPVGVLILDNEKIVYSNENARSILYLTPSTVALPESDWLPLLREDCISARSSQAYQGRYRIVTFASGNTARWWVIPLTHRDIVFLLDITYQIHADQSGRALVNDLGHELRTPMASILTHLEILGLDNVGDDVLRQSLDLARKEAQRMGRLINAMLELGRLEVSDDIPLRLIELLPLVNDVILQLTPAAQEKHMELSLNADTNIPLIWGDSDRLRQVFLNLVDNAIKYSDPYDRVIIALKNLESGVACSICDNGPGISPQHLPYITRRFYRAAPTDVEGSGLGLALVSEILRRHKSRLAIESPVTDNKGTCVRFVLPFDQV